MVQDFCFQRYQSCTSLFLLPPYNEILFVVQSKFPSICFLLLHMLSVSWKHYLGALSSNWHLVGLVPLGTISDKKRPRGLKSVERNWLASLNVHITDHVSGSQLLLPMLLMSDVLLQMKISSETENPKYWFILRIL